ncbi:MAG: hypothetical protein V1921_08515 [Candidatus Altiarchaeota archaeon]
MKVISEEPVALAQVKSILEDKKKEYKAEEKEPLYEQKRALDHAKATSKLNVRDSESLKKKLLELGLNLTPERAVKIVDIMPEDVDDVRAIFSKERFRHEESEIKKIIDLVNQYK